MAWALGMVKTRAHGDADMLRLMPLHDLCNHREPGEGNTASAGATSSADGIGCGG